MRHHQPERLRDAGLPLQPQALHHRAPPGEECQEAHHEHSQEATGPATGNTFLRHSVCVYLLRKLGNISKSVALPGARNNEPDMTWAMDWRKEIGLPILVRLASGYACKTESA